MMEMILDWRSVGSLMATVMVFRTAVRDFLPPEVQIFLHKLLAKLLAFFRPPTATILVDEADHGGNANDLYECAQLYLGARCLADAPSVRLHKDRQAPLPVASLPDSHKTSDRFHGVDLRWTLRTIERNGNSGANSGGFNYGRSRFGGGGGGSSDRSLELTFPSRHRGVVYGKYIPYILDEANRMRLKTRERRLYTNKACYPGDDHHRLWSSHAFSHPSTFDTIAIDPALRDEIRADLLRFSQRKEDYANVGRAWKRGYLLYGPPGTGKTSLVAAIANLLEFDVYDLELTTVPTNTHLRRLLVSTTPKSVVVVEDVDCSLDLSDRNKKSGKMGKNDEEKEMLQLAAVSPVAAAMARESISLSGVLNFVDGLWSSCVGERLIIFTTNHPERLDPALLRPGRMDRKVELGYCTAPALRLLARNYLSLKKEADFEEEGVKELLAEAEELVGQVRTTPAEIAEVFMGCDGIGAGAALRKLVRELKDKKEKAAALPRVTLSNLIDD